MLYTELSLTAQTMYSQLLEASLSQDAFRSVASLSGSFASKSVKGRKYWYYKYTEPSGKAVQLYVGPDSSEVKALVNQDNNNPSSPLRELAKAAVSLGCSPMLSPHFKVVRRLMEYGFFKAGGVLVGTHAFLCYGNMLGVNWGDSSRTQDVDFAHSGRSIALALPSNLEINTKKAIESLQMGFLPMPNANATYLNPKNPEFRLDFLTTLHKGGLKSFSYDKLNIELQPLKFMEYSLEDVQQAVVFSDLGASVVNIPNPARYALHKLLVYGERKGSFAAKSSKDLNQSAALLRYFKDNRPWEIDECADDLLSRGKGWRKRFSEGVRALDSSHPELNAHEWLLGDADNHKYSGD